MNRRQFIQLVGGVAAAWPLAANAQQPAVPVVGFLRSNSRAASMDLESAFRDGLGSMGFVEGRNVTIDYQYAENQNDRLPAMAAELVQRQVAVIYAGDNAPAIAAKAATSAIPIVFRIGGDPVKLGLVATLNRPGGNITGVSFLSTLTVAIKLQILHEAVPSASVIGLLVNPSNPSAEPDTNEARNAARQLGLELEVVEARDAQEIDAAFVTLLKRPSQALVIDGDALFSARRQQIAALTLRHALPAIYITRDFPDAGGLMSYGASRIDADRLGGTYVGRILKGDIAATLPVQQAVKVELIVNLIVAKALGINVPASLLARADEVIE